jgi:hypothetical protein
MTSLKENMLDHSNLTKNAITIKQMWVEVFLELYYVCQQGSPRVLVVGSLGKHFFRSPKTFGRSPESPTGGPSMATGTMLELAIVELEDSVLSLAFIG